MTTSITTAITTATTTDRNVANAITVTATVTSFITTPANTDTIIAITTTDPSLLIHPPTQPPTYTPLLTATTTQVRNMRGVVIERTLEDEFLEVLQEHVRGAETFVLPEVSSWLSWKPRALSHFFDARVDPLAK
jgi:hypothetical protein